MYDGYKERRKEKENLLAQFVTLWIANTAGKSLKRELTLKTIFNDGRFDQAFDHDETMEIFNECFEEVIPDDGREEN